MTLSFSEKYKDGTPNYFIEKIWRGLLKEKILKTEQYYEYAEKYNAKFGRYWDGFSPNIQYQIFEEYVYKEFPDGIKPKIHTLRAGERWRAGDRIHPAVNSRTSNRFQFAPVCEVKSVRKIEITRFGNKSTYIPSHSVVIDGNEIGCNEILKLAVNDGFNSVEQFFEWFNGDFEGQIIHWTDIEY